MKILVLSDSHGNVDNMARAVELTRPRLILHLGDCQRDAHHLQERFPGLELEQVPGNCDFAAFEPAEKLLCLEGVRILMCHGHTYGVKQSLLAAAGAARERKADLLLFGHTHRGLNEPAEGTWLFNPGSIGDYHRPSYGIIRLEHGKFTTDLALLG